MSNSNGKGKSKRRDQSRSPYRKDDRKATTDHGSDRNMRNSGRRSEYTDDRHIRDTGKLSSLNDLSWYSKNPLLLETAGSFPFPYRPGMDIQPSGYVDSVPIPGVYTIAWIPSIGTTSKPTDPANIAGKELFAKVREKFSGSIDADAPDFVIYLLALDSIFSYIGYLKRVYRLITCYSVDNRNLPELVLKSMGMVDADISDLNANKTRFCQYINELIGMTHKFHCPAVFDLFNRHYWMNDNVYTDAATINSQFYMFLQAGFYKYTLLNTPDNVQAGGLSLQDTPLNGGTGSLVEAYFSFGKSLIDALASSDDAYIISGYLMRAFEGTPDFIVDEMEWNPEFKPVYQEEVLSQIENATWIASNLTLLDPGATNITQNPKTNCVLCTMAVPMSVGTPQPMFISLRTDRPTAGDVTIATRLKSTLKNIGSTTEYGIVCGTECVLRSRIYYLHNGNVLQATGASYVTIDGTTIESDDALSILRSMAVSTTFDWRPITIVDMVKSPTGWSVGPTMYMTGDMHNVTTITLEQLENLHKVCTYSEFNAFALR